MTASRMPWPPSTSRPGRRGTCSAGARRQPGRRWR
jgi:hypothetical protein